MSHIFVRLPGSTLDPCTLYDIDLSLSLAPTLASSTVSPSKRLPPLKRQNKPPAIVITNDEQSKDSNREEDYSPWSAG
ncbi:hypothetical protein [Parasitella parasitica]|uniref:Uncharacterized protein n=1 Tax=Parasitella parasitica TaxID=35722 RepID=A0A0B7NWU2_9FUNG|nr:hypothetical protein [Parasitella parasitica]